MRRTPAGSWGIALLALLLAGPLLVVITSPLHTAAPEWSHVLRYMIPAQLGQTLALLAIALCTALLVAVPAAWLVSIHSFPLRSTLSWLLVLPLALPTYIASYTWAALLGPTGTISLWMEEHAGVKPDILNLTGLGVVMGLVLYPYIYLPARAAFARGMTSQLEAAHMLGASHFTRFLHVAVPLARPAIAAGAVLLCMEVLNDYGAVKYYGVRTLTTGVFRSWGGLRDTGSALRIGMVLVALVAFFLWFERRARGHGSTATDQVPSRRMPLRGSRGALATVFCVLLLFIAVGLPLSKIIGDAWTTRSTADLGALSTSFLRSLTLAAVAMSITLIVALLISFRERHGARRSPILYVTDLGYAIPGAVLALGAMVLAGPIDRSNWGGPVLIGSFGLLFYAYASRFLAVGTQPLFGALRSQPRSLDDAAHMLGAGPWRTFIYVNLPLLRPALLAAAVLVAVDVIKELPLTLILRPFNFETLATSTYRYAVNEQLRDAAWPALLIVLCAMVPLFFLERSLSRTQR